MRLLNTIHDLLFGIKFSSVPNLFVSKDDLFRLRFDENWVYSKKGNSFYSFHNLKDNLKGGLQFSIHWYVNPPKSMNEKDAVLDMIYARENEKVECQTIQISDRQAIHYRKHDAGSNMKLYHWYIYSEKILIAITFMIFQEEIDNVKDKWLERVMDIINSLELNVSKFQTTPMK